MERWFVNFKLSVGDYTKLKNISELHDAIALQIFYYSIKRIYTTLKMSPAVYAASLMWLTPLKRKVKVL